MVSMGRDDGDGWSCIFAGVWYTYSYVVVLLIKGALAQLGARNIRIVKATGSNPVCSIAARTTEFDNIVVLAVFFYALKKV